MDLEFREVKTIKEFIDAIRIRVEVFVEEQGGRLGYDPDEYEKQSTSFLALINNRAIATARFREVEDSHIKIERVAVLQKYRNQNIGSEILKFVTQEAIKLKPKRLYLSAQSRAKEFYEKCGYKVSSKEFDPYNSGLMHVEMDYKIDKKLL